MSDKPYCVGDVTTNTILGRFATAEEAAKRTTANPQDLLAFHESHIPNLTDGDLDMTKEEAEATRAALNPGALGLPLANVDIDKKGATK